MTSKRLLIVLMVIWVTLVVGRDTLAQSVEFDVQRGLQYGQHDGVTLTGDLYTPKAPGKHPALVAVHGGAHLGSATLYRHWGPYLAQRGYVLLAIDYRPMTDSKKKYPEAVHDVRAGVQFLRSRSEAIKVDPDRIGLIGESAGAYLAALVALSGDQPPFAGAYTDDPYGNVSTRVKVCVGIQGIYDLVAWNYDLIYPPLDAGGKKSLGVPIVENRAPGLEASPLAHAMGDNSPTSFLLAWATQDDGADPEAQSNAFLFALKQAGFFVGTVILPGAPNFWVSDPIEEAGSFSGFLAPRLVRFLKARL